MNKHNLEQLKTSIRSFSMTSEEKNIMRATLVRHISQYEPTAQSARHHAVRFPFMRQMFRPLQYVTLALIVVLGGGGSLAFAAQNTFPGDALYGLKVNVVEEAIAFGKKNAREKALYEITRAAKRLDETTNLAISDNLSHATEKIITRHIIEHTQATKAIAAQIAQAQPELELELASKLESALEPRADLLKEIKQDKNLNGELTSILAVVNNAVTDVHTARSTLEQDFTAARKVSSLESVTKKVASVQTQLSHLTSLAGEETTNDRATTDTLTLPDGIVEVESDVIRPMAVPIVTATDKKLLVEVLVQEAEGKIQEEKYGEALILLQQAEQEAESTITFLGLKSELILEDDFAQEIIPTPTNSDTSPYSKEETMEESVERTDLEVSEETVNKSSLIQYSSDLNIPMLQMPSN
jgi:hypothetical protein